MFFACKSRLELGINQVRELEIALDSHRCLSKASRALFCRIKAKKPGYPGIKGYGRLDRFTHPGVGDGARIIGNKPRLWHTLCPGRTSWSAGSSVP